MTRLVNFNQSTNRSINQSIKYLTCAEKLTGSQINPPYTRTKTIKQLKPKVSEICTVLCGFDIAHLSGYYVNG